MCSIKMSERSQVSSFPLCQAKNNAAVYISTKFQCTKTFKPNTNCVSHEKYHLPKEKKNHLWQFQGESEFDSLLLSGRYKQFVPKDWTKLRFFSHTGQQQKMGGISSVAKVIPICSIWLLIISLNNKLKLCPSILSRKMCVCVCFCFLSQFRLANWTFKIQILCWYYFDSLVCLSKYQLTI